MAVSNFEELMHHAGHDIEVAIYGPKTLAPVPTDVRNAAVECLDCGEVLLDFDNPEFIEEETPMNFLYGFTERDANDIAGRDLSPQELSVLGKALEGVHEYVNEVASSAVEELLRLEEDHRTIRKFNDDDEEVLNA